MTMNCPRCHADIADTATICPSCGSSVRSYSSSTFSYLPAGTPAWPTNIPQHYTYTTGNASPAAPIKKTPKATPEKPQRSAGTVLLTIAVLILVPILGAMLTLGSLYLHGQLGTRTTPAASNAGSTGQAQQQAANATPTTGDQLPDPQSFQKLTSISSTIGLTLSYPSNWVVEPPKVSTDNNYVRLYPQQQQINILFVINRYSAQASTNFSSADDMNQQTLQLISSQQGFNNVQESKTPPPPRMISNTPWTEADATYTDDNGNNMHILSLSVEHNKMYYNVVVLIPDVYYNEAMTKYILPMFNSIQFVS
jgi:hypothetical protein